MKSLKNLFKKEHFYIPELTVEQCAQRALDQHIEENGVKVWGIELAGEHKTMNTYKQRSDTHSAILIDIQPLKECEHKEAVYVENKNRESWFECEDCGKPVKAKGWDLA